MSDRRFQRPGVGRRPGRLRRYRPPDVEAATVSLEVHEPANAEARRHRRWLPPLVTGVTGLVVGALLVLGVQRSTENTPPLPITLDTFPLYALGLPRADTAARDAGASDAVAQLETAFQDQLGRFVFVHGGEGATVHYGQSLSLTIVNGFQSLPLPSSPLDGSGGGAPILVSHDTGGVSCVFRPEVPLYDSAVLDAPGDLTAMGFTDCVLNDTDRNISLRMTSQVPGGARERATDFAEVLERTHAELTA